MAVLKLQFGEEIRRIGEAPASLQVIKDRVLKLFGIQNSRFEYKDVDGDDIQFDSQEEYEEALKSHCDPFRIRVIDVRSQFNSCSVLKNEIGMDIRVCDSFADSLLDHESSLLGKADDQENLESAPNLPQVDEKAAQTSIELISQETQTSLELKDMQTECVTHFEELANEMLSTSLKRRKINDLGAFCSLCKTRVFDTIFKCSKCEDYFTCEPCQSKDSHPHILIKSNRAISRKSSTEVKPSLEKKHCELRSSEMDSLVNQLIVMGFKDKGKNLNALIKANYNLSEALNYLT